MKIVKFFGSLRELFGDSKVICDNSELDNILNEIRVKKKCQVDDVKILLNGKPFDGKPLKDGDKVSVFLFGGKGYPGG